MRDGAVEGCYRVAFDQFCVGQTLDIMCVNTLRWFASLFLVWMPATLCAQTTVSYSFNTSPDDWQGDGWTWSAGKWRVDELTAGAGTLTSPVFTVTSTDYVSVTIYHSFNLDAGFDGGQLFFSKNGTGWNYLPNGRLSLKGYGFIYNSSTTGMKNQDAFTGIFNGPNTSINLGTAADYPDIFQAGDTVQFRLVAQFSAGDASDSNYWQLDSFSASNVQFLSVPEPASAAYIGIGVALLLGLRFGLRRRH